MFTAVNDMCNLVIGWAPALKSSCPQVQIHKCLQLTAVLGMKAGAFNMENVFHEILNEELYWKCIFFCIPQKQNNDKH